MPRTCSICSHDKRAEIDTALASGVSYRNIAKQFAVGFSSVNRHAAEHIAQEIKQSQEAKEEAQALDVVKQLKTINNITLTILYEARKEKSNGMALFAIDRVMKQLELQAKLLGDIDTPQVNVWVLPEWHTIRTTIVQSLVPFPDARVAVAGALSQLEAARAGLN